MVKTNRKIKQLEIDFTYENTSNTHTVVSKTSNINVSMYEIRMNSRRILQTNYIKEKNRKELISYIIQNEKSF
ncbi:hypothetical protein [Arcobacter sp. F2176]|uniref:hypothetical protein n=1 Tax=Arcobacter sp. F2176 TaxID=2044511 RepID=UPI00100B4E7B|nr:hypothetical protein [Arcobacter sp. F2176]RXJ79485.1 hypothetical protein CRU95_14180 [Arcobacter sp. F2176]